MYIRGLEERILVDCSKGKSVNCKAKKYIIKKDKEVSESQTTLSWRDND